jgi:hypothetical protein
MTEQLACGSVAVTPGRRQLCPGYLLRPFGWAGTPVALVVSAYPTLLPDLFGITRERMHLVALALAHVEAPTSLDIASLFIRGSPREVLQRVLGRCPPGIKRALKHLPSQVLRQQSYRLLIQVLDDSDSARVLHHASSIDDLAVKALAALPPPLRRLPLALSDWAWKLNGFADSLQFLVSRRAGVSFDDLVAQLATVTPRPQLTAMIRGWVQHLPLPETIPPASIGNARRLDSSEELSSLARTWRNCLGSYTGAIDAGHCAVYLWEDVTRPVACLTRRHGRLGWFLDEIKGPRNVEIEPDQLEVIAAAFAHVGVPRSRVVSALENITYSDADGGIAEAEL